MPKSEERKLTEEEKDNIYDVLFSIIETIGSQNNLAKLLKVSQPQISYFLYSKSRLPVPHCLLLEKKFGASCKTLRPDIFGKKTKIRFNKT